MGRASVLSRRMTIDENRPPSSAHEIERYGGLFAQAHARDDLVGDARHDGRHRPAGGDLAGHRAAGHDDVPGRGLRRADVARGGRFERRRAPVRADRRARGRQAVHRPGDGRRGHGGRDRRHHGHHRRPAGDRPRVPRVPRSRRRRGRRGADLSGRGAVLHVLPGRRGAGRDGRRRDADRRARGDAGAPARRRSHAEVHLHDPELPEPGRRDDVARAPARAGADRGRAGARRARGQPVRAAALRGRAAADAVLARRRPLRDLPRHVLEDPVRRAAAGLGGGARADPGAAEPRQAGRRPVLVAADPVLRRRLLRAPRLAHVPDAAALDLPAPARRDAGLAGGVPARRGRVDAAGGRPVHLGAAAGLHRHDRPAGARAARARGVRPGPRGVSGRPRRLGDAAELLRRQRGRDPRGHPADRQGRRRAGRALRHADRRQAGAERRKDAPVVPLRRKEAS